MPDDLRMWLALVGPLLRARAGEQEKRHREPDQAEEQAVAPVVGEGHHEAEDQDPDGLGDGSDRLCQLKTLPRPSVG